MRRRPTSIQSPAVQSSPGSQRPAPADGQLPDVRDIYDHHLTYVWHSLRRLGVPEKDVPDLAHDVFIAVSKALPSYDPQRALKPWIFGIVFRVASDHLRLYRHTREILAIQDEPEPPDIGPSPEQALMEGEARQLVEDCLLALDVPHRAVLVMHDLAEHDGQDIADALGVPVKTVYSRLRTARLRFSAAVARRVRGRS